MKKLLVLILVLGLCSTANAELTNIEIDVDGAHVGSSVDVVTGTTISLQIYSHTDESGLAYIGTEDNGLYTLADLEVTTNAGDQGGYVGPYEYYGYQEVELTVSATASGTITPGTMFLMDFIAGSGTGTVDVYLAAEVGGDTWPIVDTTTIHIIPEPMTIALLGLGGLFLRRRK